MECLRLRIQDVDFGQKKIYVRSGEGGKDQVTVLPPNLSEELQQDIARVTSVHHQDLEQGYGEAYLPNALAKKISKCGQRSRLAVCVPVQETIH